jgi:hypothetical protein
MPRNAAGCGDIITITCFTQAGGGKSVTDTYPCVHAPLLSTPVPVSAPADVKVDCSTVNITVSWQPFTLVEARGFIEYLVELRQAGLTKQESKQVPMDHSSAIFTVGDTSINYEVSVRSVSGDAVGPGQHLTDSMSVLFRDSFFVTI